MKTKLLLGLFLSTTIFANPLCLQKDIFSLTKLITQLQEKKDKTDKKQIKEGLEKVLHIQSKHNSNLDAKQKKIVMTAEALLKKYK